jgi:hypothetical protein
VAVRVDVSGRIIGRSGVDVMPELKAVVPRTRLRNGAHTRSRLVEEALDRHSFGPTPLVVGMTHSFESWESTTTHSVEG